MTELPGQRIVLCMICTDIQVILPVVLKKTNVLCSKGLKYQWYPAASYEVQKAQAFEADKGKLKRQCPMHDSQQMTVSSTH